MYFIIVIILSSFIIFNEIFNKFKTRHENNLTCLVGKVAIVTGGNGAIGSEICLHLASRGCRVIAADINDSSQTKEKIISLTKNQNIIVKKIDLASFKSIREFVKEIKQNEDKLDILIHNAGILGSPYTKTEDGLNPIMQVNYLGPFLLTHLLLDLMKKAESSRIVFISSLAAFLYKLDPGDLRKSKKCYNTWTTAMEMYSKSKLAAIVASDLFAKKLRRTGITSNSFHPGIVRSNLYKTVEDRFLVRNSWPILCYIFAKSPREAAKYAAYLAASREVEHLSGKFFVECRQFWKPFQTQNAMFCDEIWKMSEDCCKLSLEEKIS